MKNYTQVTASWSVIPPHKTMQKDFLLVVSSNEKASSLLKNTCVKTAFAIPSYLPLDWLPLINPLPYQKKVWKLLFALLSFWQDIEQCSVCFALQSKLKMPVTKTPLAFWLNIPNGGQNCPLMRYLISDVFHLTPTCSCSKLKSVHTEWAMPDSVVKENIITYIYLYLLNFTKKQNLIFCKWIGPDICTRVWNCQFFFTIPKIYRGRHWFI